MHEIDYLDIFFINSVVNIYSNSIIIVGHKVVLISKKGPTQLCMEHLSTGGPLL